MKTIFLTFDYELFFKKSGTFKHCLLTPTNKIINTLKQLDIHATFFIDVLYYMKLSEMKETISDAKYLKNQLHSLVANGNRIELHLHPHWLDAKYQDNEWFFPSYEKYRLQALPQDRVRDLFVTGNQVLNEIASEVDREYRVQAFRAGGWCVDPFEKLKKGFEEANILIDSSIAPNMSGKGIGHNFDFRNDNGEVVYKFTDDPKRKEKDGKFIELKINTYKRTFLMKLYSYLYNNYKNDTKIFGDGLSLEFSKVNAINKLKSNYTILSLERTPFILLKYLMARNESNPVTILSHQKGMSENTIGSLHKIRTIGDVEFKTINQKNINKFL